MSNPNIIGEIDHPKYGKYYLWFDGACYAITRMITIKPFCAYASLSALFSTKGL